VEKYVFLDLDSSKWDNKFAQGNVKSPSVKDSYGEENISITYDP
jgi:hypothetical protein